MCDIKRYSNWWLAVLQDEIGRCMNISGKGVDACFASGVRTMVDL
jgi:hypothetical protein